MDKKILEKLEQIEKNMVTKEDAKNFVTKGDLITFGERLREEITEDVSSVVRYLVQTIDECKVDRSELLLVEARVRVLEEKRN